MIIQIEIPDTLLDIPHYSHQELMVDIAVSLFQRQLYSLAKAARFAKKNRLEFQSILAERNIPIPYDLDIDLESISRRQL